MRIITGSARGVRLVSVPGSEVTRPTPERVKEGLFSALQFDIEGRRVLDLFAGSGQLGLEALSRGAMSAVFVDASEVASGVVRRNLETAGLSGRARVVRSDYASFISACRESFDIAFLDPPYRSGILEKAAGLVVPLMSAHGIIVCEHPSDETLPPEMAGFRAARVYRYGKILLTLYRNGDSDE